MRKVLSVAILLLIALAVADLVGQEPTVPSRKATDDDYKKLAVTQPFVGKLSGVGAKSISVYVDDTGYQIALKKAAYLKEPQKSAYMKQINALLAKSNQGKEYEFELTESFELRKTILMFEYDDRGNPKKLGPAELTKLKGKPGRPGYLAKQDDVSPNMPVTVTLVKGKKTNRPMASMAVVNNAKTP